MSNFFFATACAPTFLPVNDNNELDFGVIQTYFEYLYVNGIRSLFINGGCGEFSSLTVNERKQILEKWIDIVKDDVQIVVNISTSNMADTIELGNHALSFNRIYGVAILPPFYMPINNEDILLNYLMCVAEALNQKVPILYYHIPSHSKIEINVDRFLDLIKKHEFTQLAAMKFTDSNFDNFLQFMNGIESKNIKLNIYCGYEPLLEDTIKSGAKGAILGFVSVKPDLINSVITESLDEAKKSNLATLINVFHATVDFSQTNRVNLVGLLKIATEFYSNIKLGPMKKPYNIANDKVIEYRNLLEKYKFL